MMNEGSSLVDRIRLSTPYRFYGKVVRVTGVMVESEGPLSSVGELLEIKTTSGKNLIAEVVGFRENNIISMPLDEMTGIGVGDKVIATRKYPKIKVGEKLLGRVIDSLGNPIDDRETIISEDYYPIYRRAPKALRREIIAEKVETGVRAIDGFTTIGKGQRIGIFAGSGVGKSTLLGMIARNTSADINVIILVGERGREVKEFIERDLGTGLKRSVVVVATSDEPPLLKLRAAYAGTAIAEYFMEKGYNVLIMLDSLTRFAYAQREVGLATGEPPSTKGYTPSVFSALPRLLERAGNFENKGSITGIYTVLVEADDITEPVADISRSILDGHIVLDRKLANKNHYPAIDVLQSVSRVMNSIVNEEHLTYAGKVRELLSAYNDAEDLINIGAYVKGSNPIIDEALIRINSINAFLKQRVDESSKYDETLKRLKEIFKNEEV